MRMSKVSLILLMLLFSGCANKTQTNILTFRALDLSLIASNNFITEQNDIVFELIKNKLLDSGTSVNASNWEPKAFLVKKFSTEVRDYIDRLKIDLKQESGFSMINDREFFRENDVDAVYNLFEAKGKAEELKQRLIKYENEMLAIDEEIYSAFKNTINYTIRLTDSNKDYQKPFTQTFFSNVPVIVALGVLSNFQNSINIFENKVLSYCYNKIQSKVDFNFHTTILTRNAI